MMGFASIRNIDRVCYQRLGEIRRKGKGGGGEGGKKGKEKGGKGGENDQIGRREGSRESIMMKGKETERRPGKGSEREETVRGMQ